MTNAQNFRDQMCNFFQNFQRLRLAPDATIYPSYAPGILLREPGQ